MKRPMLSSMTGYACSSGASAGGDWTWEVKTVNAKALDVRLRLPPRCEAMEAAVRSRVGERIKRGTVQVNLALQRAKPSLEVRIDRHRLQALLSALSEIKVPPGIAPASIDGLLAVPGIVEVIEEADRADLAGEAETTLLRGLDLALDRCIAVRCVEGDRLGAVLDARLAAMQRLIGDAEAAPGRKPDAVRARLAQRVAELSAAVPALDPIRLHQEAILMTAKADIREELDRLAIHHAAAAALLADGGPIGRRLDFLAQELGREAGTLCAKANDGALSLIGLDLRTEIEQFREQVQNLE